MAIQSFVSQRLHPGLPLNLDSRPRQNPIGPIPFTAAMTGFGELREAATKNRAFMVIS
jgi:hypothetical protein